METLLVIRAQKKNNYADNYVAIWINQKILPQ